jgi:hypothetical protein
MLDALREHLLEKPELYQDEMAIFLYDEFNVLVTTSSISRALASVGWTKKAARHVAKERNADLRDYYMYTLSAFCLHHLVFVDESGCDKRIGFRRTGWSPPDLAPVQVTRFTVAGDIKFFPYILRKACFYRASDRALFEDFIKQLLYRCGRWPEPKSVLVMDNASFHRSDRIK